MIRRGTHKRREVARLVFICYQKTLLLIAGGTAGGDKSGGNRERDRKDYQDQTEMPSVGKMRRFSSQVFTGNCHLKFSTNFSVCELLRRRYYSHPPDRAVMLVDFVTSRGQSSSIHKLNLKNDCYLLLGIKPNRRLARINPATEMDWRC